MAFEEGDVAVVSILDTCTRGYNPNIHGEKFLQYPKDVSMCSGTIQAVGEGKVRISFLAFGEVAEEVVSQKPRFLLQQQHRDGAWHNQAEMFKRILPGSAKWMRKDAPADATQEEQDRVRHVHYYLNGVVEGLLRIVFCRAVCWVLHLSCGGMPASANQLRWRSPGTYCAPSGANFHRAPWRTEDIMFEKSTEAVALATATIELTQEILNQYLTDGEQTEYGGKLVGRIADVETRDGGERWLVVRWLQTEDETYTDDPTHPQYTVHKSPLILLPSDMELGLRTDQQLALCFENEVRWAEPSFVFPNKLGRHGSHIGHRSPGTACGISG